MRDERDVGIGFGLSCRLRLKGRIPVNRGANPAATRRAYLVGQYGFSPEKLSPSGYAEFCPIVTNEAAEGRARNRRVDIVVLNSSYSRSGPR